MSARILILDEAAEARPIEAALHAEYYEVCVVPDGPDALRDALRWQPDLVLLGAAVAGADEVETCRRLKADPATRHVPVVMITGTADAGAKLRGLEAGADDFLTRPLEYDTLLPRLRGLVRLKRILDEWRARGETARALGFGQGLQAEPSVAGARALLVDDQDAAACAAAEVLACEGIQVSRAAGEAEALALTATAGFDLIVLSLSIVAEDPLRLVSRLRAGPATQAVPLLLVAGTQHRQRLLRGFDLGADDWLSCPVDANELRVRARNQIRRKLHQDQMRAEFGQVLEMAMTDPLTGLRNQRYLMRHLGGLLDGKQQLAVLMIDIDHFKPVNDRWGHAAGDAALRAVADTLRSKVRVFDSLARYGGEEFVVVMSGASLADATRAAERLRAAVEAMRHAPDGGAPHGLTVSIGVAAGCVASPDQLLSAADRALYAAKHAGRNRVEAAPNPP